MWNEGELVLGHAICGHQAVPAEPAMPYLCHQPELSEGKASGSFYGLR